MSLEDDSELDQVESLTIEENEEAPVTEDKPEAEVEPEAVESTETGEKDPATPEEEAKPAEADGVQRRINKITAEKYELRRQLEEERKRREELEAANPSKDKPPSLEDPDINYDQDKLVEKMVEYRLNQEKQKLSTGEPQPDPARVAKVEAFSSKLSEFKAEAPDYESVVSQMPVSQDTSDAILVMENGPQVAYYLGKHLDVLDEVNSLSPVEKALRIKELSDSLTPAQPKITEAPAPVESVAGSSSRVTKKPEDMTVAELDAYEDEQFRLSQR